MKVRLDTNDTILNGSFRTTPETRILPEPAPATSPGDFGVRLTGNPGELSNLTPIDIEGACKGYDYAAKIGLLTAAEVAELKAQVRRINGSAGVHTNAAGVTTMFDVQWKEGNGTTTREKSALSQSDVNDLERLVSAGALEGDKLSAIRAANKVSGTRVGMVAIDRALRNVADVARTTTVNTNFAKNAKDFWAASGG